MERTVIATGCSLCNVIRDNNECWTCGMKENMERTHTRGDKTANDIRIDSLGKLYIFESRLHWERDVLEPLEEFILLSTVSQVYLCFVGTTIRGGERMELVRTFRYWALEGRADKQCSGRRSQ